MTFAELTFEERAARVLLAHVRGEVDMSNADVLRASLERQVTNEAAGAIIDLTDVGYIDSAGIQLLYRFAERLRSRGQELRIVVAAGSPVEDTLHYAGALDAMGTTHSIADAERAVAGTRG